MGSDKNLNPSVRATQLASLVAALAVVVGAMVLVGWAFDIEALKSVLPGWVAMKANTAVGFILIGVALWLATRPQFGILIVRLCLLLAGVIGLLSLGEYIFGWNPGMDLLLFYEPSGAVGTSDPGRMAPETALCFVLLAAALWLTIGSRKARRSVLAPVLLGLLVTALALAAGLSYTTPTLGAYGWFGLTIMAIHTAVLFAMLGMAVMAISWHQDALQWSLGRNATAAFSCGLAVLVLIGFNINRSQFWVGETNRKITYSEETQGNIENILIEVIDAQAHTRGYIITGDEQFKSHYFEAKAKSNVDLDALRKRIVGNPHQQELFARIEAQAMAQLQWFQQVIDARQTRMDEATRNNMIRHGEGMLDNFRITYKQIKEGHQQHINELKQESKRVARFSYITIATGTLASLLLFMVVIFRLNFAVSESRQAENTLRESEEKFSKVFESNPAMIAIGTLDGKIVDVNLSYANFLGFSREEMLGKSLTDLGIISAEELQRLLELDQRAGTFLRDVEVSLRARGGNLLNALLSADIVSLGGVPYRLATLQDITARKQAEIKIAEQLDELRRWHDATSGREGRILDLKHEVNELLGKAGQPPRYPSAEADGKEYPDV